MADDYRQASLDIWDRMAAGWEKDRRFIWNASRPVTEWLVDALDPQPGETVLELAAGVGDAGFAAAVRLGEAGRLISTDFSAALRETRRVLRPGGRVAFSVWGYPAANPWACVPADAYVEHTGARPPDPLAPGIFAM